MRGLRASRVTLRDTSIFRPLSLVGAGPSGEEAAFPAVTTD